MKHSIIFTLCLLLALACLMTGSADLRALPQETALYILTQLRLPTILMAIAAGIALSLSGLTMQTITGNNLADPSLLGITAGASLGSSLVIMIVCDGAIWLGTLACTAAAFVGAMTVALVLLSCSRRSQSRVTLLLVGVMLNFLIGSIISVLTYFSTPDSIRHFVSWGMGSLSGITLPIAATTLVLTILCTFLLLSQEKVLDALLLGERHASTIGIEVRRSRTFLLLIISLLTGTITAICGPIAFIGLAIPHVARRLCDTANHKTLIPSCALLGATALLLCQLICQGAEVFSSMGLLPINALTPMLGAPIVIYILLRQNSRY